MAIEFRCSQCNRLLRTGEDTAGKQAQCPECGAITTIPASPTIPSPSTPSETTAASSATTAATEPSAAATEPSATVTESSASQGFQESAPISGMPDSQGTPSGGFTQPTGFAPASSFSRQEGPSDAVLMEAARRVAWPANALVFWGALGLFLQCMMFVDLAMHGENAKIIIQTQKQLSELKGFPPELTNIPANFLVMSCSITGLLMLIACSLILYGGLQMRKLQRYAFAMVAAIVGLIPCLHPCSILPLPFAIWALVVLSNEVVRAGFRR
jgi:phage FluMu protein Com